MSSEQDSELHIVVASTREAVNIRGCVQLHNGRCKSGYALVSKDNEVERWL